MVGSFCIIKIDAITEENVSGFVYGNNQSWNNYNGRSDRLAEKFIQRIIFVNIRNFPAKESDFSRDIANLESELTAALGKNVELSVSGCIYAEQVSC